MAVDKAGFIVVVLFSVRSIHSATAYTPRSKNGPSSVSDCLGAIPRHCFLAEYDRALILILLTVQVLRLYRKRATFSRYEQPRVITARLIGAKTENGEVMSKR